MEVHELRSKLEEFRPFIVLSGKEIDKSHEKVQEFIELNYKLTRKRVGEGTCKNCIFDAYMELSIKTDKQLKTLVMPSKFKMKEGRVVIFNNTDYTNANMTDEVAMKMVAFNVKHAGNFLNPDEVLQAFAELSKKPAKKAAKVVEEDDIEELHKDLELTLEYLRDKYKDEMGKKPHWRWSAETILEKLNED